MMGTVLYADVLFFINLIMDYLVLYITARLTHTKTSLWRLLLATSLGGAYGVAAVLFIPNALLSLLTSCGISVVMTLISFGVSGGFLSLIRQSFLVWGCGALLSGIMSILMSLGEPIYSDEGNTPGYAKYFILTFAAGIVFVRIFSHKTERKGADVVISLNGEIFRFSGLADSGNLLRDPIGGCPVIIAAGEVFTDSLREGIKRTVYPMNGDGAISKDPQLRVRVIPQRTVGGEGMLFGFVPDEVTVNGKVKSAVIAIDDKGKRRGYGGFDGIVPLCLYD